MLVNQTILVTLNCMDGDSENMMTEFSFLGELVN